MAAAAQQAGELGDLGTHRLGNSRQQAQHEQATLSLLREKACEWYNF